MQERVAVLTGDLVKSTRSPRDWSDTAFERLTAADEQLRRQLGRAEDPKLERFRGDGWQALIRSERHALRAALVFAAAARSVHTKMATRISVGVGHAAPLASAGLGASDGPAFRLSGRGLEHMKRSALFTLVTQADGESGTWPWSAFTLAGAVAEAWTQQQAEVMRWLLLPTPPTQTALGARLGITQQSVQGRFDNGSGGVLVEVLERLETADE